MSRYFRFEEPALEAEVDAFLARLAHDLEGRAWKDRMSALVLAGGYGRGEGGIFRSEPTAKPSLYNDLEFFFFSQGAAAVPEAADWARGWEKSGTRELGVDVEFKLDSPAFLKGPVPTMFAHDLIQGHRVVWGDAGVLAAAPSTMTNPALIPPEEASRLLFNRGSGLFFGARTVADHRDDPSKAGFVERNIQKARLALADAVLAVAGRHHGLCEERARRIAAGGFDVPPAWDRLRTWHAMGVRFKLQPEHTAPTPGHLADALAEIIPVWASTFLWLESKRLGERFSGPSEYVRADLRLFPKTPAWRNLALRVRDRMRHGERLAGLFDYPRAALMRALVAVLSGDSAEAAARIGCAPSELEAAYRRWWARYN